MILYKYLSVDGIKKVLESGHLKFSSVETFNDPFEFLPPVIHDADETMNFINLWFLGYVRGEDGFDITPLPERREEAEIKRTLRMKGSNPSATEEDIKKLLIGTAQYLKNANTTYLNLFNKESKKARICSFSETKDNSLMWGHYTGNHKGGVLGFDLEAGSSYEIGFPFVHPVKYSSCNPNLFTTFYTFALMTGAAKGIDGETIWRNSSYTKSIDWAYEREWRSQVISESDTEYTLVPFKDTLRETYFGCRISEEDKKEIRQLLINYNSVKIFTAKQNFEKYSLVFSEEDPINK